MKLVGGDDAGADDVWQVFDRKTVRSIFRFKFFILKNILLFYTS